MKRYILLISVIVVCLSFKAQTYSIVDNAETEVFFYSLENLVCKEKRTITILEEKGKSSANFYRTFSDGMSILRKFSATVKDSSGKIIHTIKKSDLNESEYSAELSNDTHIYFYEYTPVRYPFTITYEWEEKHTDGIIALPPFSPQQDYHQEVKKSFYRLIANPDLPYKYKIFNGTANIIEKKSEKGEFIFEANLNNLKAIAPEPYAPESNELFTYIYLTPLQFKFDKRNGEMKNWSTYGKWLYGLMEDRDKLPNELIQLLKDKTNHCTNNLDKIKIVYDFLAATTRYVSVQLGIGGLQPSYAENVYHTGFGDCKGLTNYTRAMLSVLNIPSTYTIINTENENFHADFASANQANHVILQVPLAKDTLWIECTNPQLPLGYIHHSIAGHDALLVTPEGGVIHRLPTYPDSLNTQLNTVNIILANNGNAEIDVLQKNSLLQYESILDLSQAPLDKQKDYIRSNIGLIQAEITNIKYKEHRESLPSIDIHYGIKTNKYSNNTGKRMFLPLNIFRHNFKSPPKSEERMHDINIKYGHMDTDSINISLPDNFTIESMPKSYQINTPFGYFSSFISINGNNILITQRFYMKKGKYKANEYTQLVSFLENIEKQYNEQIILKLKE